MPMGMTEATLYQQIGAALQILIEDGVLPLRGKSSVEGLARTIEFHTTLKMPQVSGRQPYPSLATVLDVIAPADANYRRNHSDIINRLSGAQLRGKSLLIPLEDSGIGRRVEQ